MSLILPPIEIAYKTSCWSCSRLLSSNLGPILPRFRDIRLTTGAFVRWQKATFSAPHPYSGENFGLFPLESKRPRLTHLEIIFEEFQPRPIYA